MMKAKDCIMGRRSVRAFKDQAIDTDLIKQIVEEASYAPSWKHTQITRYTVVTNKEVKDRIGDCTSAYPHNGEIIKSAPAVVCVNFIKNRSGFERDGSYSTDREWGWQPFDVGCACEAFCLAAYEHGLGSVIMGIFDRDKVEEVISLSDDREVMCLIPIGYPAEEPVAPKRKPVDEVVNII